MSGTLPPCMVVVSLALKASFSSTVTLIFTFGCAASYCLTASAQTDFIGSLFWMCHHSIVTGSPLLLLLAEPSSLVVAAAAARDQQRRGREDAAR